MAVQLKTLFLEALRKPIEERWAFLDAACGGDLELRRDVAELLSYHGQSGDLLDDISVDEADRPPLDLPERLGDFVIEGLLGAGALGVVYLARRMSAEPGAPVALKVLRQASLSGAGRRRFGREVEALARLDHPGIARLIDAGMFDTPSGPRSYLVTELAEGISLREWAAASRPNVAGVLAVIGQLCDALGYAHDRGVVHRDLKPENIVITPAGQAKILDFGMARLVDSGVSGRSEMTRVGEIVGTVPYMSPEQAQAGPDPVDGRADLYALGVIAYELLSDHLPIEVPADSLHRAIVAILTVEPRPLGGRNPACWGDLEYVVGRLLAKRPADRHPSAQAVRADIERVIAGRPITRQARPPTAGSQRRLVPVALGALAIGAVVVALAMRLGPDAASASHPRNRAVIAAAMRNMAGAFTMLHGGDGSEALVRKALVQLDSAEARLQSLPGNLPISNLYRAIHWRQGEGHYFLGAIENDKEEFWKARTAFDRCWAQCNKPFSPDVIDPTMQGYSDIVSMGPEEPIGGIVLVHMALATYEQPLTHLRTAAGYAERTFAQTRALGDSLPWRSDKPSAERERLHGFCMTLNNRSFIRARLGFVMGDRAMIDEGLAGVREADQRWPQMDIPEPRGANLHNLGRAWRYRGVVTGSAADLDSAEAAFRRALTYRDAARYPREFATTEFERGRVVLARVDAPLEALHRTLRQVRTAREIIAPMADILEAADGRVVEAELLIGLAERASRADQARLELARADVLLGEALAIVTVARFPLQHTEALRVRARYWEARGRIEQRPQDAREAELCLTRAIEITTPTEEPFRLAQLMRMREELSRAPGRARAAATRARTTTGS